MKSLFIEFNTEYTTQWWERLLADEDAMNKWLCKLWNTEKNGYDGNLRAAAKYTEEGSDARATFNRIAQEELDHSHLLLEILKNRGITPVAEDQPNSKYWPHVMKAVTDLQSCAAASAIGERLAALRFEVIENHPDTPEDIMGFVKQAGPDEAGHCRDFMEIAGKDAIENALARHYEAVEAISSPSYRSS